MIPEIIQAIDEASSTNQDSIEALRAFDDTAHTSLQVREVLAETDDLLKDKLSAATEALFPGLSPPLKEVLEELTFSVLIDFTTWSVCVEKERELVISEKRFENYMLYFIQSNIELACTKKDQSIIVSKDRLTNLVYCSGLIRKIFDSQGAGYWNLGAKLNTLGEDLQLLRYGKFQLKNNVLDKLRRVLGLKGAEFDANAHPQRDSEEVTNAGLASQSYDSSPPVNSSTNEENELSQPKDLGIINVVAQSTQTHNTQSVDSSVETRVDVQATSSSTGASQTVRNEQILGNNLKESETHELIDSRIHHIIASIDNATTRKEFIALVQDLKAQMPDHDSFLKAYNETRDAFETILQHYDSFRSVHANLPVIKSFLQNISSANESGLSIKSASSSQSRKTDSQELVDSHQGTMAREEIHDFLEEEVAERNDAIRVLANYLDRRLTNLTQETHQLQGNFNRVTESSSLGFLGFQRELGMVNKKVRAKLEFDNKVFKNMEGRMLQFEQRSSQLRKALNNEILNIKTLFNNDNFLFGKYNELAKEYASIMHVVEALKRETDLAKTASTHYESVLKMLKEALVENERKGSDALLKLEQNESAQKTAEGKIHHLWQKMDYFDELFKKNGSDIENLLLENQRMKEELERVKPVEQLRGDLQNLSEKISQIQKTMGEADATENQENTDDRVGMLAKHLSEVEQKHSQLMKKVQELELRSFTGSGIQREASNEPAHIDFMPSSSSSNKNLQKPRKSKVSRKHTVVNIPANGKLPIIESFNTKISNLLKRGKTPISSESLNNSPRKRPFEDISESPSTALIATGDQTELDEDGLKKIKLFKNFDTQ